MSEIFTEAQAISLITRLTRTRLVGFVEAELVRPAAEAGGWTFAQADLARLELLCDLADAFDLDGDALGVVIGLVDQLHEARASLRAMAEAIEAEPAELRARLGLRLVAILGR